MTTDYRFMEVALATRDVQQQVDFWTRLFDARVIFRGRMMGQPYVRLLACGITLIFREKPGLPLPPGPEEEVDFHQHLGLRVANLQAAIAALEGRGAKFVLTPATLHRFVQVWRERYGATLFETELIAPPLDRARLAAGELRHEVAILAGPDNLWIELNEIQEPADLRWYPG